MLMLHLLVVKQRSTTPVSRKVSFAARTGVLAVTIFALAIAPFAMTRPVLADKYDDQIAALEKEISQYDNQAKKLSKQAATLEGQLAKLNNQRDRLQAQIDRNQLKYDKLVAKIAQAEKDIQNNRQALGAILSDYYIEGDTSTLELLASSDNIADFVDKQAYRESIQKSLASTVKKIGLLKKQLEDDQKEVKLVLDDMNKQKKALVAKENEKQVLISQTRGRESSFRKLIKKQNSQISELQDQQAAAMREASSNGSAPGRWAGSSSYPWPNASMEYDDNCAYYNGSGIGADDWGYCLRQCTSYVAWKLATDGKSNKNFSGLGNAANWGSYGSGISASNVAAGDAIIWYIGFYGHVMYVDSVNGQTVNFSEYNANPAWGGTFSNGSMTKGQIENGPYEVRRFH